MAKLETHKFHSKELLPLFYKGKDPIEIEEFEDKLRKGYRFAEGEQVIHIHNHDQIMVIEQMVRKSSTKDNIVRLDGIICHWWA